MTYISSVKEKKTRDISLGTIICLLLLVIMLYLGSEMKSGVLYGINICFTTVIPTLFPFFILSDFWSSSIYIKKDGAFARIFERLFGISGTALPSFFLGTVCGFPLGVKSAAGLYENKMINKDELERLIGFANNPSIAFVISGIGAGIYSDTSVGIRLYISVVLSAILVGAVFKQKRDKNENSHIIIRQKFDLVGSIKSAGISSITVSSYIIFFCALINLVKKTVGNRLCVTIISGFLEVTNASFSSASLGENLYFLRLPLTAFALGFSGFSVHLQSFALLPKEISKTRYITMKLLQGLICSFLTFLFVLLIK